MWRLNNNAMNNQWTIKKIKGEIKKYQETNENRNMTCQNPSDAATVVLRGNFIVKQTYIKKKEKSQVNNLTLPKGTRRRTKKINEIKSCFFEKINRINKALGRLTERERGREQVNKIRNERGEVTTDTTEIQRIIRYY